MTNFQLSIHLFLQLAIILAACRVVGWAGRLIGQPQVVGEMIAGVLLGPSLLGLLAPEAHAALFPKNATMTVIYCMAQIGL
ncbi:MAG: cation:proton antiporter, partial [Phycisphaerales bacterium]|nr:cation:proton antiporter [Phycisphaerales bacterium]